MADLTIIKQAMQAKAWHVLTVIIGFALFAAEAYNGFQVVKPSLMRWPDRLIGRYA